MVSERFEMRIDSDQLDRLDEWRQEEGISRAEAVRQLIEMGLAESGTKKAPHFSDGEKLIVTMLGDLITGLNVDSETDVNLVKKIIYGGHYWAFDWEMPFLFSAQNDKKSRVNFVVDVLDMWDFIEHSYGELDEKNRELLIEKIGVRGKNVKFAGFDGNNESEYLSIARFLVEDLERFEHFKSGRRTALNSHSPSVQRYKRMLGEFERIREKLIGRTMTMDELAKVLDA